MPLPTEIASAGEALAETPRPAQEGVHSVIPSYRRNGKLFSCEPVYLVLVPFHHVTCLTLFTVPTRKAQMRSY